MGGVARKGQRNDSGRATRAGHRGNAGARSLGLRAGVPQGIQHGLGVPRHFDPAPALRQAAIRGNQKGAAFDAEVLVPVQGLLLDHGECLAHDFIGIADQREWQGVLGGEVLMRLWRVARHPEDGGVRCLECGVQVAKILAFAGAARGVVLGVEIQRQPTITVVGKVCDAAGGKVQSEVGNTVADIQHHASRHVETDSELHRIHDGVKVEVVAEFQKIVAQGGDVHGRRNSDRYLCRKHLGTCLHGLVAHALQVFDGDALAIEEIGELEQDAGFVGGHHLDHVRQQIALQGLGAGAIPGQADALLAFKLGEHRFELGHGIPRPLRKRQHRHVAAHGGETGIEQVAAAVGDAPGNRQQRRVRVRGIRADQQVVFVGGGAGRLVAQVGFRYGVEWGDGAAPQANRGGTEISILASP